MLHQYRAGEAACMPRRSKYTFSIMARRGLSVSAEDDCIEMGKAEV
jgi:hypothetical protein